MGPPLLDSLSAVFLQTIQRLNSRIIEKPYPPPQAVVGAWHLEQQRLRHGAWRCFDSIAFSIGAIIKGRKDYVTGTNICCGKEVKESSVIQQLYLKRKAKNSTHYFYFPTFALSEGIKDTRNYQLR